MFFFAVRRASYVSRKSPFCPPPLFLLHRKRSVRWLVTWQWNKDLYAIILHHLSFFTLSHSKFLSINSFHSPPSHPPPAGRDKEACKKLQKLIHAETAQMVVRETLSPRAWKVELYYLALCQFKILQCFCRYDDARGNFCGENYQILRPWELALFLFRASLHFKKNFLLESRNMKNRSLAVFTFPVRKRRLDKSRHWFQQTKKKQKKLIEWRELTLPGIGINKNKKKVELRDQRKKNFSRNIERFFFALLYAV